ncbi:type II toxin-antitoxin system RelB/DinJ family antitoxin [Acinetobacter sp.]|uniref:type II toxin-antitoxin system RelB/DinJ family antitoxin n=1 Tax=Acinetobacter sp. TaxID=472 RepID=UPI003C783999
MTTLVKKRVQYTVDQAIMESAEYIMAKVGLTPATVLSMVYAEIARTGKIPVTTQVGDEDFNTARLIAVSHNIPIVKVSNDADAAAFLEDDGGY